MAILKIRDENGNVQEILSIKGDKGDRGEQGIQGIQGEPGKDAVTDLSYKPESPNAQSGIAVAQAITQYTQSIEAALDRVIEIQNNLINGEATINDDIVLNDQLTNEQYTLYVENGKLTMKEVVE